ncbi:MAG: OmpH family outer membrane protein [Armatimonadota bacterium]
MVKRSFELVVIAVLAVFVLSFTPARAADASVSFGYVDVTTVFEKYTKTEKAKADLDAFGRQLELQLRTLDANKLLDENDSKELISLVIKPNPNESEKARIKELQDKEKALDSELKGLQSKQEPTDQEKARQKELMDRASKSDENLKQMSQSADTEFNTKKESTLTEIRNDFMKAVEEVAKQKKVSFVVDKIAVFYGGVDLTQQVLDKLNGKKN